MKNGSKVIYRKGVYAPAARTYVPTPRDRGCPEGGKITFTKAQVDKLPDVGSMRRVSLILKIDGKAVRQWTRSKKLPLPHRIQKVKSARGMSIRIQREELIAWLKATGRLKK